MTTSSAVHPDEVLKALIAKGNRSDKERKLRKLHELCCLEYSRHSQGARDLSIANMARVAESHGLFKARTIYNKQSEDYASLIRVWEAYSGPKESKLAKEHIAPTADKYAFMRKIEDPAIRGLCLAGLAERDKLRVEVNMLKGQTKVVVDMRPLGAEIAKGAINVAVIETAARLTDSERNALVAAIDPKNLMRKRWRLGETGEILDEQDRFVFNPGFATGIAKILGQAITPMIKTTGRRT